MISSNVFWIIVNFIGDVNIRNVIILFMHFECARYINWIG